MAERTVIDDRYELEPVPIGEGGMGEVYRAYDRRLDRRVAVKIIRFPFGQHDETLVKRFLHESRVMARLEHPGTPAIHDVGVFDDPRVGSRPFMVMQFVEGIALDYIVDEHEDIPLAWVASAAAQVAAVLAAAHGRGILHRDLKPSNLMLCRDGTVKVLDFGLAMFHDPELSRLTRTGTLLGTPSYMSPEQVRGASVGPQSDLYTLGLVMHELLTGQRLFDGRTEYEVFDRQVNEPAPAVREVRPDVPEEVDRLVLRLLEKRAEDRPAEAAEVCRALLPFARGADFLPGTVVPGPDPVRMYAAVVGCMADAVETDAAARTDGARGGGDGTAVRGSGGTGERNGTSHLRDRTAQAREEAAVLVRQARHRQAADLLESVLGQAEEVLGSRHPDVLALRTELAEALFADSDYRRAAPVFRALHQDLALVHGHSDDRVLHCRRREATCQALMGQTAEALRLLRRLLADQWALHGPDDRRTLELRRQIGLLELGAGDTEGARRTLSELLEDLERRHGPEHPDTVKVRESLQRLRV